MRADYIPGLNTPARRLYQLNQECAEVSAECARLTEGCSNLAKAVTKFLLFGSPATDEKTGITYDNIADIQKTISALRQILNGDLLAEIADVELAISLVEGDLIAYQKRQEELRNESQK